MTTPKKTAGKTKPPAARRDLAALCRAEPWRVEEAQPRGQAAVPPPPADRNSLVGAVLWNTGAFIADGALRQLRFDNVSGVPMFLRRFRLWWGCQAGGRYDAHAEVFHASSATVAVLNADHYAEGPQGAACEVTTLEPYVRLDPGEFLLALYVADGWGRRPQAHLIVWAWWQYGPPPQAGG